MRITLPAWHHGTVYFHFEYDAADPQYSDPGNPSLRLDPRDMMRTGNEQDGYGFDPGAGSLRLWLKDGGGAAQQVIYEFEAEGGGPDPFNFNGWADIDF